MFLNNCFFEEYQYFLLSLLFGLLSLLFGLLLLSKEEEEEGEEEEVLRLHTAGIFTFPSDRTGAFKILRLIVFEMIHYSC